MGTDTPIAALSATSRGCSSTTSASCSRRSPTRRWTRSARSWSPRSSARIGPEANLLDPAPASCRQVVLPFPVIDNDELAKIRPHQPRRRPARLRSRTSSAASTPSSGGGDGAGARGSTRSAPRSPRRSPDGARIIVLSDRHSDRRAGADPVAAAHRRGAPPPGPREDPHPGRAGRRGRRRPRGAPRRAADRLRRGRGQPVPRDGVRRGPRPATASTSSVEPEKAVAQPDQGARQGRAQGDVARWASRRSRPTPGRRSSRRSACRQDVVDRYFTGTTSQARRRRARRDRRGGRAAGTRMAYPRRRHRAGAPRRSRSAASTSGAARASRTCSTRRRSSGCSTPPAPGATTSSSSTPTASTSSPSG